MFCKALQRGEPAAPQGIGDRPIGHHIADGEAAARLEHAEGVAQDAALVGDGPWSRARLGKSNSDTD